MKESLKLLKRHNLAPIILVKVRSKSDPDFYHFVGLYEDGHYECDCIYFLMKHKDCRHIIIAKEIIKKYHETK